MVQCKPFFRQSKISNDSEMKKMLRGRAFTTEITQLYIVSESNSNFTRFYSSVLKKQGLCNVSFQGCKIIQSDFTMLDSDQTKLKK